MSGSQDPKSPFVLALDVGTSSTRALLFDANGTAVPNMIAQRTYKLTTSATGEVSVDADELATVVEGTISEVLHLAGPYAQQICAVALDTFWHSLLGIDSAGRPLTPVITWEDTRAHDAVTELRAHLDEDAVHSRTGVYFHASYWPAKLRWLAASQPQLYTRAAQWISFGEYLHRRFLGRSVCSFSMASGTGLLNIHQLQWDTDLIRELGLASDQLPTLADADASLAGLVIPYAERWPTLRDVPWFPAIGDGASACLGSGCVDTRNWSLTMGTSSAMRVVIKPEHAQVPAGLWLYVIDKQRLVLGGALSEGGNLLNWLCNTLKLPPLEEAERLMDQIEPDSHGLTVLPFISGERSMGWHSEARLTIGGLSRDTTPEEILRASYEALAYRLQAIHQQLTTALGAAADNHTLVASGGVLLGSSVMKRILADTLETAIYPSREHEASARGVALQALEALGIIPDLGEIEPSLEEPTVPSGKHSKIYHRAAERQSHLYTAVIRG